MELVGFFILQVDIFKTAYIINRRAAEDIF